MGKGRQDVPLAADLQRFILESGMSLNQLGQRTGVSQGQLSRFVRGNRTLTLPAVDKICRYFGLKLTLEPKEPDADAFSKRKGV